MIRKLAILITMATYSLGSLNAQGCMSSGGDVVGVHGFIQPQYSYFLNGTDADGNNLNENNFNFNRARLGVSGSIPYDIDYYFYAELSHFKNASKTVHMLDAYVSYTRFSNWAKITLGQFKSPFSLEQNTSCAGLYTVNRSEFVNQLAGPQRDMGVMISGGNDTTLLSYSFAIMNGTGMNVVDDNDNKNIIGRLVVHPLKDLKIGGSFNLGKINATDPAQAMNNTMRVGADLSYDLLGFKLQSEYILGQDELLSASKLPIYGGCGGIVGYETKQAGTYYKSGFMTMLSYMTPFMLEPVLKFDTFNADHEASNRRTNAITVGLNYYVNDYSRVMINYINNQESTGVMNDAIIVQLQAKF